MKKVLFVSILLLLCNSIAKAWDATDLEMYFPFIFDFDNSTREATIISLKGSAESYTYSRYCCSEWYWDGV